MLSLLLLLSVPAFAAVSSRDITQEINTTANRVVASQNTRTTSERNSVRAQPAANSDRATSRPTSSRTQNTRNVASRATTARGDSATVISRASAAGGGQKVPEICGKIGIGTYGI